MYSTPLNQTRFEDYSLQLVTIEGSTFPVHERACLWPLDAQRVDDRVRFLMTQPDRDRRIQALMSYTGQRCLRYYRRSDPLLRPRELELRWSRGSYRITPGASLTRHVERSEVVARIVLVQD